MMMLNTTDRTRIMVAEDHELVRNTLCTRLAREPNVEIVATAGTLDDTIIQAANHRPDIILMDIDLQGKESLEAVIRIRATCPNTRIIFVSAFVRDRYIDSALALKVHGYVSKRESLDVLIDALHEVIAGRQYFSEEIQSRVVSARRTNGAGVAKSRLALLTPKQIEILTEVAQGFSKKEIAHQRRVSVKTIESHIETIMNRIGVHDRVDLTRFAIREGLAQA